MAGGWASLGLLDELVDAAENEFEWILPTAVQDECIPLILGGGDVLASSETGSGKTAAFALPILQLCHENKSSSSSSRDHVRSANKGNGGGDAKDNNSSITLKYEMSAIDRDKLISVDPSGCLVQCRDLTQWSGCRCTAGVMPNSHGNKFYYECEIMDEGIVRVGYATADASLNLGTDNGGYGFGGTGMKAHKGKFDPYLTSDGKKANFSKGDVIGCLADLGDKGCISFSKNGRVIGKAFDLRIPSKKGDTFALFPAISLKNAECKLNLCGPFRSEAKDGYRPIGAATLQTGGVANPRSVVKDASADRKLEGPLAIVIEPTRDLAQQTYDTFGKLASRLPDPNVKAALLVGGLSPKKTLDMLARNSVDVLVATPPICASYVKQTKIQTSRCQIFVLDEADNLVGKDTIEDIMVIFSRLPKAAGHSQSAFDRLQVCFFSATLHSKEVKELTATICHRPLWVDLRGKNESIIPDTVHHCVVHVDPKSYDDINTKGIDVQTDAVHRRGNIDAATDSSVLSPREIDSERIKLMKPHVLIDLLERFEMDSVLVFCRTNLDCDSLEKFLRSVASKGNMVNRDKFSCRVLAGMRSMQERQASLKAFKEGEARILIATDVAARGIDIRELPFVVNMMLPDEAETYVHRIGRVGRAERIGLAISIVATADEYVWWCQKGKKPPCSDTRLFDKGGNCKWYNEQKLLKQIESLLKRNKVNVTKLSFPVDIPSEMAALIKGKGYGDYAGGDSIDPELNAHLTELSSIVNELSVTEFTLQSEYWKLKDRFSFSTNGSLR